MQAQKVTPDEFTEEGKRLFNFTKPHALIYADGHSEAKYLQDGQYFRGDRTPIEGMIQKPNEARKLKVVETTAEEVVLSKRTDRLEADVKDLKNGIAEILALLTKPADEKPAKSK